MRTTRNLIALACGIALAATLALGQQSDFAIKEGFEQKYTDLFQRLETATAVATLDSLKSEVDAFELLYAPHEAFLDKAIFPDTFVERIRSLRTIHSIMYERVYLITTQGVKLEELESRLMFLTAKLDTLTIQGQKLEADLAEAKKSNTQLREAIRRLQANMGAKDRLIFALVDSIFLPYGRDTSRTKDLQNEAIGRKLERANVLARIEEVAGENAQFIASTRLQPKDYSEVVEQYQQFANRWKGLREKLTAAMLTGTRYAAQGTVSSGTGGKEAGKKGVQAAVESPGARVDTLLLLWGQRLQTQFWEGLAREFSTNGVKVDPFTDAASFSASVRAVIARVKATGEDATPFVETVWKGRIDREWRDALSKQAMLGAAEYAALDREVSELARPGLDAKFILYAGLLLVLLVAVWWIFIRKPKETLPPPPNKA